MERCEGRGVSRSTSSSVSGMSLLRVAVDSDGGRRSQGEGDEAGEGGRRVGGGVVSVEASSCALEADSCQVWKVQGQC